MVEKKHGIEITNSRGGEPLTRALKRRLLEVLFDGREEAREDLAVRWRMLREATAKEASKIAFNLLETAQQKYVLAEQR